MSFLDIVTDVVKSAIKLAILEVLPYAGGYVYFIQSEKGGPIKIGFSEKPESRLNNLQTSHPDKLIILGCIKGDQSMERELHKRFSKYRIRQDGEWFNPGLELTAYIRANCTAYKYGNVQSPGMSLLSSLLNPNVGSITNSKPVTAAVNTCGDCKLKDSVFLIKEPNIVWCLKHGKRVGTDDTPCKWFEVVK